jgi:hypothetical protein
MSKLNPAHVNWSRDHFRVMSDGGTWAVPRSGMVFVKHGNRLELSARMPHDPAMPITPEELQEQQQADFDIIKLHFEAAGVTVIDVSRPESKP